MIHNEKSPLADKKAKIKDDVAEIGGNEIRIEDWMDRVIGQSWKNARGNFACINYAMRAGISGLPTDDEVLYGKIGGLGYCVHVTELEEVKEPA